MSEATAVRTDCLRQEIRVVGRVLFRTHVAENLVAARVVHGFGFAQFARVFTLAHRRMVVGDFADLAAADLVETRIAHVPDDRRDRPPAPPG